MGSSKFSFTTYNLACLDQFDEDHYMSITSISFNDCNFGHTIATELKLNDLSSYHEKSHFETIVINTVSYRWILAVLYRTDKKGVYVNIRDCTS